MHFVLKIDAIGKYPEIPIDEAYFNKLKRAKSILNNALYMEEKYEILIQNYMELEKEILEISTEDMISRSIDYSDFFVMRIRLNRGIVNLLTSARLYIDQLQQHVCACLPQEQDVREKIKSLFAKHYDQHVEYRFMEALRNYVQHRGLAVHDISVGGAWTSDGDEKMLEFATNIYSSKKFLEDDNGFKKGVLIEIGDKVDLKTSVRRYIGCLSNVHKCARELVRYSANAARNEFDTAIRKYKSAYKESFAGLAAINIVQEDCVIKIPIFTEWDDERVKLLKRNKDLSNITSWYVTGKTSR